MLRAVVVEEVAMSQGQGQTCNLSLLTLAALLTKEFLLRVCAMVIQILGEGRFVGVKIHLHLHVSADAVPF